MWYGYLTGLIFLIPYAILGIFTGNMIDGVGNRKNLFGLVSILWSCTTLIQALYPNIYVFIGMRFLLAVFESFGSPLMYSLLRDYFPPSRRVIVTSIVGCTINFGDAMSSLSLLLIKTFGWQFSYYVTSGYGIAIGVIAIVFLREPRRGQYELINRAKLL